MADMYTPPISPLPLYVLCGHMNIVRTYIYAYGYVLCTSNTTPAGALHTVCTFYHFWPRNLSGLITGGRCWWGGGRGCPEEREGRGGEATPPLHQGVLMT